MDDDRRREIVEEAEQLLPPPYVMAPNHGEDTATAAWDVYAPSGPRSPVGGKDGFPSVRPRSGERILGTEPSEALATSMLSFAPGHGTAPKGDAIRYDDYEGDVAG